MLKFKAASCGKADGYAGKVEERSLERPCNCSGVGNIVTEIAAIVDA
jgi:hypothetical protein